MEKKAKGILVFAVLIEGLITYVNQFFVLGDVIWQMVVSICLGIAIALIYKLDFPKHFDFNLKIPYVGCILTGIIISRLSNYIFDILTAISSN